jgi:uncharacterized protein (DUF58 family)
VSDFIVLFLVVLAIIAAVLRADFVLTVIYVLLGAYLAGRAWSQRALGAVTVRRMFQERLFYGEKSTVRLEIHNPGLLPVAWLQMHESLPVELTVPAFFQQVITLGPKEKVQFTYTLEGRKRGYYALGPLMLYSGDVFGVTSGQQRRLERDYLTVYPRIIPLNRVRLPSRSPLGTLRHSLPIFEDPTRVLGKRDYVTGDSLRRVDWKATAATGRLQVKLFEPSIALETAIFLDLNAGDYAHRTRVGASELAIVVAASIANWVTAQRQAVGLATNGVDPLQAGQPPAVILPRPGRAHLIRVLESLARLQVGETFAFESLLQQESAHLSWGTTLVLITPKMDDDLFDGLFQARRSGLDIVLVPCGPVPGLSLIRQRAEYFNFPLYHILNERDLEMWQQ